MTIHYWIRCDKDWNTIAEGKYSFLKRLYLKVFKGEKFIKVASWRDDL